MKTRTATLTLALTAALGTAGIAYAANGNPFALNDLSQGYQVAQTEKTKDGKCGEGKCGGTKNTQAADPKAKEGKCGEGKCGATKQK
ncbi:MAG: HvfA family oxazolone/thioamide-modified RiPP metallophore [Thiobacillus sp.]